MKKLLFLLFFSTAVFAYDEGMEYIALDKPVKTIAGDKVEVKELFWYGCPHCYNLEPTIKGWLKNKPQEAEFIRQPAIFSKNWATDAGYFYTIEKLGLVDKLHEAFFKAIHEQNKRFTPKSFASWVAGFKFDGIDEAKVEKTLKSFATQTKIRKAAVQTAKYKIDGVPTIVVAGKYITSATQAGNYQEMMKVVNFLVKKESAEKK